LLPELSSVMAKVKSTLLMLVAQSVLLGTLLELCKANGINCLPVSTNEFNYLFERDVPFRSKKKL
jgi:hypothetical protein